MVRTPEFPVIGLLRFANRTGLLSLSVFYHIS
ncbi:hypothetical protein TIFTF001_055863, partial [Ficus carica]